MDLIRYTPGVVGGQLALFCTDCGDPTNPLPPRPIWTEADAAEQVTELCLANLVAIAEEHEREHHADEMCAHCGKPRNGLGIVNGAKVCHTGKNPAQFDPIDCYRLVTVYGEPLGLRKDDDTAPAAPAPPPGSYWTDLNGKVWDLSCQYLDRHHRLFRVSGIAEDGPVLKSIQLPNLRFPLAYVVDKHGPLVAIPPKVEPEPTHYGNGTHGGPAPHKGKRENCPAPECLDAEADEAEERDEETRRVRILLNSVSRFIERWAEADEQARTDLWRGLSAAADPVADLFDSRIADLDHRAAHLPDGGLATKPCHCYPRCAAEG